MKNECNIIRDILPLYVEDMVSADTSAFVEEHLEKCAECRAELENMKKPNKIEISTPSIQDNDTIQLKSFKKKLNKKKRLMIGGTVVVTIMVILVTVMVLWSPVIFQRGNPVPYLVAATKISEETPYVQVNVDGGSSIYISKNGECPELFEYVESSRNVELIEQVGGGYIFSNGVDSLIISSEVYWGKYMVWQVPNKTLADRTTTPLSGGILAEVIEIVENNKCKVEVTGADDNLSNGDIVLVIYNNIRHHSEVTNKQLEVGSSIAITYDKLVESENGYVITVPYIEVIEPTN